MIKFLHLEKNTFDLVDAQSGAYKVAAERLLRLFLKNPNQNADLMYGVLHLYRQFLEWKIKETIRSLRASNYGNANFPTHRKLDLLWKELLELMQKQSLSLSEEDLDVISSCIKQMNELDELALYASCGHHLVEIQVDAQELALTMQLIEVAINTIEEENREQISN